MNLGSTIIRQMKGYSIHKCIFAYSLMVFNVRIGKEDANP